MKLSGKYIIFFKTINILDLSKYLYGENNQSKIADYAKENQFVLDNEFQKNTRKWSFDRLIFLPLLIAFYITPSS